MVYPEFSMKTDFALEKHAMDSTWIDDSKLVTLKYKGLVSLSECFEQFEFATVIACLGQCLKLLLGPKSSMFC